MGKTRQITLKGWGESTSYLTNQNVSGKNAGTEYAALLKGRLKGYLVLPGWATFRDIPESRGCDKVIIKAWYWRGNWSDPEKRVYARLYKPQQAAIPSGTGADVA